MRIAFFLKLCFILVMLRPEFMVESMDIMMNDVERVNGLAIHPVNLPYYSGFAAHPDQRYRTHNHNSPDIFPGITSFDMTTFP
jgi:hypothetical protein